ncbi:TetR/AcrR family transcriptional regulator [Methanocella sp. MCL-LM]|uniref:TetR/AcrR family transcriptional regulator n=1 Tax=Methanocella sp. MCL-LM TaxID=3412035 RepID=UPI003C74546B
MKNTEQTVSTKELIMDAAIDLFSKWGYDKVSIREIAREVGIRESSIYNHYKGKEELMDTIINYFISELSRMDPNELPMEALLEQYGPEGFMTMGAGAYLQRINTPRIAKIWRIISIELFRNDKVRAFFKSTMVEVPVAAWEQTFRKMMELGYIRECDTRLLAQEFFYHCIYLFFDYFIISFDDMTYDTFTENMLKELEPHIKFIFNSVKIQEAQ